MQNLCLSKSNFIPKKTQLVLMHKLKKYTPLKVYDVIKMTLIWKDMKFIFKLLSLALRLQALEEKACLGNLQIQKETKQKNPNQLFHLCLLKVSILASVLILCTCTSTVMTSMFQTCFFSLYIQCHHYIGLFYFGDFQLCQQNQMKMNWFQRKLKL